MRATEKFCRFGEFGSVLLLGLLAGFAGGLLSGCGTPAAPQAPSLKLPDLVKDLTADRAGGMVTLRWTMPKKTTDRLLLSRQIHGAIPVRICVRAQAAPNCETIGSAEFAPEEQASFMAELTNSQQTGEPRLLLYFVEVQNRSGKSAGLSNAALVAGGAAPPPIKGLTAEVRADGVALHWSAEKVETSVRLHRTLLTPPAERSTPPSAKNASQKGTKEDSRKKSGLNLTSSSEPLERDLRVDPAAETGSEIAGQMLKPTTASGALDPTARFGEVYQYTAQRIQEVKIGGATTESKTIELDGAISAPIRVDVIDTFPPAVPQGLAAVAVEDEKSIDLSWQPDTEEDLAGYLIYRADGDSKDWKRISGEQPVTAPAYRDATVEPGHSYRYAVSAIDLTGHESKRSIESQESFPKP